MAKYIDVTSIIQVIGNVYNNPSLLDNEDYFFSEEDFPDKFHKILFGSILNLYKLGATSINLNVIEDYLKEYPKSYAIYEKEKGAEFLQKLSEVSTFATFDYYYKRMKKMTLLRMYSEKCGMNLSWLYDIDNILDTKKKQLQEEWFDNTSIEEIADIIDKKIIDIRLEYVNNSDNEGKQAGEDLLSLLQSYKDIPEIGIPMYGNYINTIFRGARLKKVYLRSASTGVGKTRCMIADACTFAASKIFNPMTKQWEDNGVSEPTLYISTEQEYTEIQTMITAFISGVDEHHIVTGNYQEGEWERITEAVKIIETMPLYVVELPDFSLKDIEDTIKKGIRKYGVRYICHDYIHTSIKILSEISSKAGIKGLREDNILFMISVKLKDIANKYGIFIETGTQLNGDYRDAKIYDQNLLRGAKSIADKIDAGVIMLDVVQEDLNALESIITTGGYPTPNVKISVYKNRGNKYKGILLWCYANRGICRIDPLFITNYRFELQEIEDWKIINQPRNIASAF